MSLHIAHSTVWQYEVYANIPCIFVEYLQKYGDRKQILIAACSLVLRNVYDNTNTIIILKPKPMGVFRRRLAPAPLEN